jgi:uncharacterized membrane protein
MTGAPTHIADTVQEIARLRAEHDRRASPLQRTVERFTATVGSPGFLVFLTILLASWIGLNCVSLALGNKPIDPPPFYWMQGAVALAALYMTVFILATQRREDGLANRHEQLTLELAMLSEQKTAKLSRCWRSCARTVLRFTIGLTRRLQRCRRQWTRAQFSKP